MVMSNAERQRRWREKRNVLVAQAMRTRNPPLDLIVADHLKRGLITAQARRLAVQRLLKEVDAEEDAELIDWLRAWSPPKRRKGAKP